MMQKHAGEKQNKQAEQKRTAEKQKKQNSNAFNKVDASPKTTRSNEQSELNIGDRVEITGLEIRGAPGKGHVCGKNSSAENSCTMSDPGRHETGEKWWVQLDSCIAEDDQDGLWSFPLETLRKITDETKSSNGRKEYRSFFPR